jgi:prevent-host-death family protein
MRSVNIAELKDHLSAYVTHVKNGETVVIRERNRPVARLIPFVAEGASEQELELAAKGLMRLPEKEIDWDAFFKLPIGKIKGGSLTQALLDEREEGR